MVQKKGRGVARGRKGCRRRRAGLLSAGLGKRGSAGESVLAITVATCRAKKQTSSRSRLPGLLGPRSLLKTPRHKMNKGSF